MVNGTVSEKDFYNFYLDQNSIMPAERDAYFISSINLVWDIPTSRQEPLHYQAHKSGQITDFEDVIYEKIR